MPPSLKTFLSIGTSRGPFAGDCCDFVFGQTRLLGLGGQQELTRRMAGQTVQEINKKEAARAANIKCSRPKCGQRQGNASGGCKFKVCSRCQKAMYCSSECQVAHWKEGHKAECKKK